MPGIPTDSEATLWLLSKLFGSLKRAAVACAPERQEAVSPRLGLFLSLEIAAVLDVPGDPSFVEHVRKLLAEGKVEEARRAKFVSGSRIILRGRPQIAFRPTRLVVSSRQFSDIDGWSILDIRIGPRSQTASAGAPMPASAFSEIACGMTMPLDLAQAGVPVDVHLLYESESLDVNYADYAPRMFFLGAREG